MLWTLIIPYFVFTFSSENFLKLKVYYGELNFEVIEEELAYTVGKVNSIVNINNNLIKSLGDKLFTAS